MRKPTLYFSVSAFSLFFACFTIPAFAQHSGGGFHGGGGGGGFHGGGGGGVHSGGGGPSFHGGGGPGPSFHGGGGFHSGGYGPPAGAGAPHYAPAPPTRSSGGSVTRPGTGYSRPGNGFNGGASRPANPYSAPPASADGRWHSFGAPSGSRGPAASQTPSGNASGENGLHIMGGSRESASGGTGRSFSGQGREVWENFAGPRNVVPRSQSMSSLHSNFHMPVANSGARSSASLSASASSRLAGRSVFANTRPIVTGFTGQNSSSSTQLRGTIQSGIGFNGRCWNCGFGFRNWGWRNNWGWNWGWGWGPGWGWGFGWGWGWPWAGYWGWDPFWYSPWWGWPSYGYGGYYGYPDVNIYNYPDSGYSNQYQNDNSNPPPQQYDQGNDQSQSAPNGNWVTPNEQSPAASPNSSPIGVPVLIYMKNGAVYTVTDYWMSNDVFYYVLSDGNQNSVALDQVDLARTNEENAKSGVKFIIKSEPSIPNPSPGGTPNKPGADRPTLVPTPQIQTVPQPDSRI